MAFTGAGLLASCDSGDSGGDDGAAQAGQTTGLAGYSGGSVAAGGSSAGAAQGGSSTAQGGEFTAQGGGVSAQGGSAEGGSAQGGGGASGGSHAGGATSEGGTTSTGGAGSGGKGGTTGAAGAKGTAGAAGAANTGPQPLPSITGGSTGFATRYWDCCKPACRSSKVSCSSGDNTDGNNNQSACAGGNSFMCYDFEPFQDTTNQYVAYAFAASHQACGSCYELQFSGKAGCSEGSSCPGLATGLAYKTLYVQVLNTGDIANDQFDLLIPGGGVGQFNACSNEWGTSDLGATYGGFFTGCKGDVTCTQNKCNTVFANKPDLLAGCNWFLGWYTAADNPQITYKSVACPSQLTNKSGMGG